jgi:hypothetical protein
MSLFLGFTERNNFGRSLFPVNPMGEVVNFNQLLIDEFAPKYGIPFSAWSCARRLWSNYTGNLIEVRRSTDNALLDIGYNSENELDTATLLGFLAGATGTVRTLYDQTGAGNHFQQTTLANQPRIVNAGVLDTRNGKPSMFFDGVNDSLIVPSSTATYKWLHDTADGTRDQYINIVAQAGTSGNPNNIYAYLGNHGGGSGNIGIGLSYDDRASVSVNDSLRFTVHRGAFGTFVISSIDNNLVLPNQLNAIAVGMNRNFTVSITFEGVRSVVQVNKSLLLRSNTFLGTTNNGNATFNLQLGATGNNAAPLLGYISELVLYRQTLASLNIASDVQESQMNYYGI